MNPIEYVESVKARLSTDSIVVSFETLIEFANLNEGYIRVRATLTNGGFLDSAEFVKQTDVLEIASYRHQWLDEDKNLVRRWDNALHYPDLENFPHHIHKGGTGKVTPGVPTDIFAVLDEIAKTISE
jgi:hypothetical protein